MSQHNPTLAALVAGLEDSPWHQLKVIADAHEDAGHPALSRAWRWLAENRRWPRSAHGGGWFWCPEQYGDHSHRLPCLNTDRRRKTLSQAFALAAELMAEHLEHAG